jgi:putative component of toxin-antitoxin plasmid stabilization module
MIRFMRSAPIGGDKSTQKRDILRAKQMADEFEKRSES